jgi:hypothetical protein
MATSTEAPINRRAWAGSLLATLTWGLAVTAVVSGWEPALLLALVVAGGMTVLSVRRRRMGRRIGGSLPAALTAAALGFCLFPLADRIRAGSEGVKVHCRLKQIALAMHNYNDAHGNRLPGSAICGPDGRPLLSWRVAMLPYFEQEDLYKQFHLDEPWDSPHNLSLLPKIPYIYQTAPDVVAEPYTTLFQIFVGPGTPFGQKEPGLPRSFPGGTSNTIFVTEASIGVPWTKPADLVYDPNGPLPPLGKMLRDHRLLFPQRQLRYFRVALADGTSRSIPKTISEATLRAAITSTGQLGPDW